jgi:hypothetical protein
MTSAEEQEFIRLWNAGTETAAIAQQLGIPVGTVSSCASTLARQGKIQPRPKGGAYPRQKTLARQQPIPTPVQRPVQTLDTGAVQIFDTGPVQRLDRLEDEVLGLRRLMQSVIDRLDHPPVQTPVQITALPPYPQGKAVRWNLWILDAIRDELAALAAERGVSRANWCRNCYGKCCLTVDHRPHSGSKGAERCRSTC